MQDNTYIRETSWKIIYSTYDCVEKRAVELISREVGERLVREPEVYKLHVLPCERENENTTIEHSAIVIGTFDESRIIQKYVSQEELPERAYGVKTVKNPDCEDGRIVLITARQMEHLYLAAATYLDDHTVRYAPKSSSLHLKQDMYKTPMSESSTIKIAKVKTRSIFAWGHPINDYRKFISDMARIGLNQLILWNDFAPINARDIVEYAHSYGIEVIWGYAWGWTEGQCEGIADIEDETLSKLKLEIVRQYDEVWRGIGDGIYFQSFTEKRVSNIGGRSIANAVRSLVNDVAEELYKKDPMLHIQFGLHATSVKDELDEIAQIDRRIEIVWEDCGAFPYAYMPEEPTNDDFNAALEFTEKIVKLRGNDAKSGLVFKGFAILDWQRNRFVHQRGRFILGDGSSELSAHDRKLRADSWRVYTAKWIRYGEYARRMAEHALKLTGGDINLCMAGLFDGDIWAPEAMCASVFLDPTLPYEETVERIISCRNVKLD